MKIGMIADIHVDGDNAFASQVPMDGGMITSRVRDALDALHWAGHEAAKREVNELWVLGDVFHEKNFVDQFVLQETERCFSMVSKMVPVVLLVGNHDAVSETEHSLLWHLKPYVRDVIYKHLCVGIVQFAPWYCPGLPTGGSVLVGHLEMAGAVLGPGEYESGRGLTVTDLRRAGFQRAFLGHYHKRQKIGQDGEYWYIGSLLQHNFGEEGNEVGLTVWDTDSDAVEFVPNCKSPKFVTLDLTDEKCQPHLIDPANYVRVRGCPKENQGGVRKALLAKGGAGVTFETKRMDNQVTRLAAARAETINDDDLLREYVARCAPDCLDKGRLVQAANVAIDRSKGGLGDEQAGTSGIDSTRGVCGRSETPAGDSQSVGGERR